MLYRLPVLTAVLAVCILSGADKPPEKQKDPQSSYEPRSKPGAGQKFLEQFVGDWNVVKTFYPLSGGKPAQLKGECRQTMIHGGRFLQSEFTFGQGNSQVTGLGLIGYEVASGTFTSVWMSSRSTRMSLRQSQEPFNGKEIVLYSQSLQPDGKAVRRSRTVTHLEDNGQKIVHRQYTLGPDGKERLVMELLLTRKAVTSTQHK